MTMSKDLEQIAMAVRDKALGEFHEFDNVDLLTQCCLILTPYGFKDSSWHNDHCPSLEFNVGEHRVEDRPWLRLWINWKDEGEHVPHQTGPLHLSHVDPTGSEDEEPGVDLHTPEQVLKAAVPMLQTKLAREFSKIVRRDLADHFAEIVARNEANGAEGCATHDFCDANEIMDEAFMEAFGRGFVPDAGEPSPLDILLWNGAWSIARRAAFIEEGIADMMLDRSTEPAMISYTCVFMEDGCEEGCGPVYPDPLIYTVEMDRAPKGVNIFDPEWVKEVTEKAELERAEEAGFASYLRFQFAFAGFLGIVGHDGRI